VTIAIVARSVATCSNRWILEWLVEWLCQYRWAIVSVPTKYAQRSGQADKGGLSSHRLAAGAPGRNQSTLRGTTHSNPPWWPVSCVRQGSLRRWTIPTSAPFTGCTRSTTCASSPCNTLKAGNVRQLVNGRPLDLTSALAIAIQVTEACAQHMRVASFIETSRRAT